MDNFTDNSMKFTGMRLQARRSARIGTRHALTGAEKKKGPRRNHRGPQVRQLPTLPPFGSTIGVGGFNFSVRNGKRWGTAAIAAGMFPGSAEQTADTLCRRETQGHKLQERTFRAISTGRLWRRRLYTSRLSTWSSTTALVEISSRRRLRA